MLAIFLHFLGEPGNAATSDAAKLPAPASRQIDFLKDIQPILTNTCFECHGPEKQKGGLRLDQKPPHSRAAIPGHYW